MLSCEPDKPDAMTTPRLRHPQKTLSYMPPFCLTLPGTDGIRHLDFPYKYNGNVDFVDFAPLWG